MVRTAVSFVGGFLLGMLAIWVYDAAFVDDSLTQLPELDETTQESGLLETSIIASETDSIIATTPPTGDTQQDVTVRDQESGSTVQVDIVTVRQDGWVVVHEESAGTIGNALGALRRDAGTHEDLTIPLLRETKPGQRYWIVVYADNGDQEFSLESDFPIRTENDLPITAAFFTR